jgi:hypothetical protein
MKTVGLAYHVIVNLVSLAVVAAMFDVARTPFENVVIAGLVLIYVALAGQQMMLGMATAEANRASYARFIELRTIAGRPPDSDEIQQQHEMRRQIDQPGAALWIKSATLSLMGITALFQLITAVL